MSPAPVGSPKSASRASQTEVLGGRQDNSPASAAPPLPGYYRAAPPGHQAEPDGGEPDAGPNDEERGEAPVPNQTPLAGSSSSVSFTLDDHARLRSNR